ncbi:MAG: hypothetical protein A2143_01800 [Gallionellales bacterium RBG_16_57_15]|nr:MAG: hypothetical protein A2143_01800 [Gallionellales bacterium RBG_16_57_15]
MTRAEFARFLGVSKTAITDMVKAGKITIDVDGRLDPRKAVSQLLRTSDPARLRSIVLRPLVESLGTLQRRIAELEGALAAAEETSDFNEGSALEFIEQQDALRRHLEDDRAGLAKLPANQVVTGVIAWLDEMASGTGDWQGMSVLDCIDFAGACTAIPGASDVEKGEGADR